MKKKDIRHIIDDLESSSNDSDDSDDKQIKAMRLFFFEEAFLKTYIWKCPLWVSNFEKAVLKKSGFWGSKFENVFFEGAISNMFVLREQFQKSILREQFWVRIFWGSDFENVFFEGEI